MEIEDNGKGFSIDKMSMTLGHGLSNMHTRIRNAGGEVEITSSPGEGATILAWLPID
jgi:signal transduction histidine kinase